MKTKIIDWLIATIVQKIKLSPFAALIIAAIVASVLYGIEYMEAAGYVMPGIISGIKPIAGFIMGFLIQMHSTKYVNAGKPKK